MEILQIDHPEKGILKVPYQQYMLNENQQFACLGIDFTGDIELGEHEGIEYTKMGKLNEQNFIFQHQIANSLFIDSWDFISYPNPEIILITKHGH